MTRLVEPTDAPRLVALLELLPEMWATVSAGEDGEHEALVFLRAAYGAGYTAGLEERIAR